MNLKKNAPNMSIKQFRYFLEVIFYNLFFKCALFSIALG